jgi:large subunit ribosomal protein L7/L12
MEMAALEERIKAQEEKLKQLKALKQKQEALKKAADAKRERADDTRRKILIGAMMLEHMAFKEETKSNVMAKLDAFLTRPDDRALFDLPPVASGGAEKGTANKADDDGPEGPDE